MQYELLFGPTVDGDNAIDGWTNMVDGLDVRLFITEMDFQEARVRDLEHRASFELADHEDDI